MQLILKRHGSSPRDLGAPKTPQKFEGAPCGAPSFKEISFFSLSKFRISNCPGATGKILEFIFAVFPITCRDLVVFTPLTRFLSIRNLLVQQPHFEQNVAK